ncbi:MAG TPA: NIL domain-containing protein [Coleofasciculaceae cyanobacterium]
MKTKRHSALSIAEGETRFRIRVYLPQTHLQKMIISQLTSEYGLAVHVIGSQWDAQVQLGQLDLELMGSIAKIRSSLSYLKSLNLTLKGKPNPDGDGWHY